MYRRLFQIFVILATIGMLSGPRATAQNVNLWLEAENTNVSLPFFIYHDDLARNGKYVMAPNGTAQYNFNLKKDTTYYLWYRAINPKKGSAFFFDMDSLGDQRNMGNDRSNPDMWFWKKLTVRNTQEEVGYKLTEGKHTLYLFCPEGNINIDAMYLTYDTKFDANRIDPFPPRNGIWLEAEKGIFDGPFTIVDDLDYSGKKYLKINKTPLEFKFNIPEGGKYRVYGRLRTPTGGDDSFYFKMDNEKNYHSWNNLHQRNYWYTMYLFDSEVQGREPIIYDLLKGSHTFYLRQREDGSQIDGIWITNDLVNEPFGPE